MTTQPVTLTDDEALATQLRILADDSELLWNVARRAIEDELVEWRDARRFMLRNNGFCIAEPDGERSSIIRFGPETGVRIALKAIADHLAQPVTTTDGGAS